ncbi:MAG TPA: ATP-binding cassette domain-containing protein [Gemmatimonadaceae bacterium]|nr:ATP-binding cassette domain-containing protein [Gemmatimonadaceae bacterium]
MQIDALRDVTFEVPEGEVFGIIGRNGAGKSTLLKILSRITTPSSGRATLRGHVASLLEVGTGFHPELTGRENVYLNGTLLGMSARDVARAFDEICDFAGIGSYIDTPIKRYSSGMQLRLAFAVAAHLAADTMVIDEVLAVGDAEFQAKCTRAMSDAAGRGRTTLFVSHNMAAVEHLCTQAVLLEHGQVVAMGSASDIVRLYLQRVSAGVAAGLRYVAPSRPAHRSAAVITGAEIAGGDGGPPVQGEDLVLKVDIEAYQAITGLQLLLGMSTLSGTLVSTLCSGDVRAEWNVAAGKHRIIARVCAKSLLPRAVTLSLRLMHHWGAEVFDNVPDALAITMQERDVLGTGVPLKADRGIVWMDAAYRLESMG